MSGITDASLMPPAGGVNGPRDGILGDGAQFHFPLPDRSGFSARDVVGETWGGLGLPTDSLKSLCLDEGEAPVLPSSFKIGILAQGTIGLSALLAAQIHALRNDTAVPIVRIALEHAAIEFNSPRLYLVDGTPCTEMSGSIGGLHKTSDGHVRVHDGFSNHVGGMLKLVGLPEGATREQFAERLANWTSIDVETSATVYGKMAAYAVRTYRQWDALPQSGSINSFPIDIEQISAEGPKGFPSRLSSGDSKCLKGLRVVEMSRVIAAPVAGRTLAAHGADVIWVTSPNLPDLPVLDRDLARGKRTVQLDIHKPADKTRLLELLSTADVFIQGYRPGSLAAYGLSPEELSKLNPGLIIANLSAFGPRGPWSHRRGFDSLVQTCSGMNVSEAEHAGKGETARPMPCQVLDHAGGYLLAAGIMTGVYRRATAGGSWRVDVSLAGVMKYLRSLGQYPGASGFEARDYKNPNNVPEQYYETKPSGFGALTAIRHTAWIEGCEVGWEIMPKPLGQDEPEWR